MRDGRRSPTRLVDVASPLPTRLMTRVLSVVVVVVLALVLAGCRIEPRVDIDVAPDGSGIVRVRVRLDAAAAAEIGDPSLVRLDDIRAGGWDARPRERCGIGDLPGVEAVRIP